MDIMYIVVEKSSNFLDIKKQKMHLTSIVTIVIIVQIKNNLNMIYAYIVKNVK